MTGGSRVLDRPTWGSTLAYLASLIFWVASFILFVQNHEYGWLAYLSPILGAGFFAYDSTLRFADVDLAQDLPFPHQYLWLWIGLLAAMIQGPCLEQLHPLRESSVTIQLGFVGGAVVLAVLGFLGFSRMGRRAGT